MHQKFKITEERLDTIAKKFNLNLSDVRKLCDEFKKFEEQIKELRLAHITRVLEIHFRKRIENPAFFIECKPYEKRHSKVRGASSMYLRHHKFAIFYDDTLSEKEIRNNIAHELGHLYLLAGYYTQYGKDSSYSPKLEKTTEPLSSIFGLFVISERNHSYDTLFESRLQRGYDNWEELFKDFLRMFHNKP